MLNTADVAAAAAHPVSDAELAAVNGEARRSRGRTSTTCTATAAEASRSTAAAGGSPVVSSDGLFATTSGGNFAQIGVGW